MGVYVLRGEFPIFFWMQDHAGVPESYVAAPLFFLFGISRRVLDRGAGAQHARARRLAVYRTGVVLFGRAAGLLGILFTTVVSAYVAANYTLARSYYIEHLLVGQLVLLGAALWLARPLTEPARCRVAIAMGLAGGLGLYCNFQIVDALVPAVAGPPPGGSAPAVPARRVARRRRVPPREPALLGLQPDARLGDGGDRRALPGPLLGGRRGADPRLRSACRSCWASAPARTSRRICRAPWPGRFRLWWAARSSCCWSGSSWESAACVATPGRAGRGAAPHRDRGDPRRRLVRRVRPGPSLPPAPGAPPRAGARSRRPVDVARGRGSAPSCGSRRISSPSGWTWRPTSRR